MIAMFRHLARSRRGTTAMLFAGALPMIVGLSAVAVDLGAVQLETRRLQGLADAAALHAAGELSSAQARAQSFATGAWPNPVQATATTGSYTPDGTIAVGERFQPGASVPNAVRVRLVSQSPAFFARVFGTETIPIARTATAARIDLAGIAIGSRLASLDGGLLNQYLSALTGSSVSLSVMDHQALLGADIDLLAFLGALRTTASLDAVTYDDILASDVAVADLIEAAAAVSRDGTAAQALRALAAAATGTMKLAPLVDLGTLGGQGQGGEGLVKVDAMTLVSQLLQQASGKRRLALDMGAGVPGLASTRVMLALGERPQNSPWIAVTDSGEVIVRTAQMRAYVETRIGGVGLPGLGSLVAIELPLFVELASAEAKLQSIACSDAGAGSVTVAARTGPGTAAVARIDTSRFDDFSAPLARSPARLVDTLLVDVTGSATIALGAAEPWQPLTFTEDEIAAGTPHHVASSTAVTGVATSLARELSLDASVLGLPLPVGPILNAVGAQLALVTPALDTLLTTATGALGVRYGEADVWVTGMRCGQPALVA